MYHSVLSPLLLLLLARPAFPQGQIQQQNIDLPQTQHQINLPKRDLKPPPSVNQPLLASTGLGSGHNFFSFQSAIWMNQQADDLLDVIRCYLDQKSVENEVAAELRGGSDAKHLIEVRINLLKTLAAKNAASHCK